MSSDTKALTIFTKLSLGSAFQRRMKAIRRLYGIPPSGFKSVGEGWAWVINLENKAAGELFRKPRPHWDKMVSFFEHEKKIMKKFKIPMSFAPIMDEIITLSTETARKRIDAIDYGCTLLDSNHGEELRDPLEYWAQSKKPYALILIHDGVSIADIVRFIKSNGSRISRVTASDRIRARNHWKRDGLIFKYGQMTREELEPSPVLRRGQSTAYLISKRLKADRGIALSEASVKSILKEQRALRR